MLKPPSTASFPPLLLLLLFHVFAVPIVPAMAVRFAFNGFPQSNNLIFLQSSSIEQGKVSLTQNRFPADKGRVLYSKPVGFKDGSRLGSTDISSFSTTFIFSIEPGPEGLAQGMAFLITPNADSIENSGRGYLGLFNDSINGHPSLHTFAVELDTYRNPEFHDADDNHVGIDINNIVSIITTPPAVIYNPSFLNTSDGYFISLKSMQPKQIWIDYDGNRTELNISITADLGTKPPYPFFSNSSLSLSSILQDNMFIGFSASGANLTNTKYYVHAWGFSNEGPSPDIFLPSSQDRTSKIWVILIPILGSLAAFALCSMLVIILVKRHCQKKKKKYNTPSLPESIDLSRYPQRFSYKELCRATDGFNEKNLVGKGGFGNVYKGLLPTGMAIAVKRVSKDSQQGVKEFMAEINIIGRLQHRNLVPLLGWSLERGFTLVYEYKSNGSLDAYLFEKKKKKTGPILTWAIRHKILQGVGSALVYLHEGWEQKIIHRDVKASNVLLDGELNAQLGDFGLARLYEHDIMTSATTNVAGTFGYLAPEYVLTRRATEKVDVYSFGALALEVVTGRRIMSDYMEMPLSDWLWQLHDSDRLVEAIDSWLLSYSDSDHAGILDVLRLGMLCSHPDSARRPPMRHVLQMLTGDAPFPAMPTSHTPYAFTHFCSSSSSSQTKAFVSSSPSREYTDSQQLLR